MPLLDDHVVESHVIKNQHEYWVVQHRMPFMEDWGETQPLDHEEAARRSFEEHEYFYEPGHIRVVKKMVVTTVETETTIIVKK